MEPKLTTRRASIADLDTLVAIVQAGFDSYAAFAPKGWRPRQVADDAEWMAETLAAEGTWALLGLVEDRPVGHVSFFPGRDADSHAPLAERALIPGLAHLWQLFIVPEWWGRGVAPVLHDAAIAEMTARGFREGRLYTPSRHARARRFYERRGWSHRQDLWHEGLRLTLSEYRRPITQAGPPVT